MRKICVIVGSRANYSSIKSVMSAVVEHPELQLQLIVGASALLDRFGAVVEVIEEDGFVPDARISMIIEGETPSTMAKSTGLGLLELPTQLELLRPNFVVSVGDRFETIATAVAAAYMNIPVAHTMGGEVSGTIDESIRHAVTKLSHVHFPANEAAAKTIIRMGEDPGTVHVTGCPRIDLIADMVRLGVDSDTDRALLERDGVGGHVNIDEPFLLAAQHPVTTEYGNGEEQIHETLMALRKVRLPTIMLWPNVDAGSEDIARGMRKFREHHTEDYIRFYKNFPVDTYVRLLMRCACAVGNSSAPLREGAFLGVPTVNVGTRQTGRERAGNVMDVGYDREQIEAAIRHQLTINKYEPSHLYGDGRAGRRIADVLAECDVKVQKRLHFDAT